MTRLSCIIALLLVASCHDPDPTLARMLSQRRGDPYEPGVMRHPPAGTVAHDDDSDDPPPPVTRELVALGRARYDVVCASCHGLAGDADTFVASKMEQRKPASLHEPRVRSLTSQQLFSIVTDGYGLMPAQAERLETARERWAVVAYVHALQLSQRADVASLTPSDRARLP